MPTDKHGPDCLAVVPELPVADLAEAQAWFRDVLGFQTTWVWNDRFAAIHCGEVQLYLRKMEAPASAVRCYLHVVDADRWYARCLKHGSPIIDKLESKPWGAREFAGDDLRWAYPAYRPR